MHTIQLLFMFVVLLGSVATLMIFLGSVRAAKTIHDNLLKNVLRWPMETFDTTPIGRVLKRFSKDVAVVDDGLSIMIHTWVLIFVAVNFSYKLLYLTRILSFCTFIISLPLSKRTFRLNSHPNTNCFFDFIANKGFVNFGRD